MFSVPLTSDPYNEGSAGPSLKVLLQPRPFTRENYSSYLFKPYSAKLMRLAHLYTQPSYDLWAMIESDPDIRTYNEMVPPIAMSFDPGTVTHAMVHFVTVTHSNVVTVHTISAEGGRKHIEDKRLGLNKFCNKHQFQYKDWTQEELNTNPTEIANLKILLRYTTREDMNNKFLEEQLINQIRLVRKIILHQIIQQMPKHDPEEVKTSLFRLILDRRLFSDIHRQRLSLLTEVSAHHEFD